MLVSLVIDNYNCERYVRLAVESALAQTHPELEVIVVDDGSQDGSRDILRQYVDRVDLVFKPNGGQQSALNAGFEHTRGEMVIFLDGDDLLHPEAAAAVATRYRPDISRYQWYLEIIDGDGRRSGARIPSRPAEDGDLEARTLSHGPRAYVCPPTSGNAWARSLLEQVMPLPEVHKTNADQYLTDTAPLYGRVLTIDRTLGCFRVHGKNAHTSKRRITTDSLQAVAAENRARVDFLADRALAAGKSVPPDRWVDRDWRMLLVRSLLYRSGEDGARQSLRPLIRAVLRSRPTLPVRLGLAVFVLVVGIAPRRLAFALAGRILRLEYM